MNKRMLKKYKINFTQICKKYFGNDIDDDFVENALWGWTAFLFVKPSKKYFIRCMKDAKKKRKAGWSNVEIFS